MRWTTACVAVAALSGSASCYTMRHVTVDDLSNQRARRVWVTRPDQSTVLINDAQMFRGKLVGFVEGKYHELPSDDLHQMKVRKIATVRTVALLTAAAAVGTTAAVMLAGNSDFFDDCIGSDECDEDTVGP